ncbi:alginate O-acetyltransferase AlgX-related protein [Pseudomonas oryziphila]|uniref:Cell division protein FtsQ n=1 Tax=Pseudomonas oryziphila TaxID=2894079 RepID=A0ABM7CRB5_9PSED|nr:cell division protein FtsQ [Pseudomonas oryziphila]AZL73988.1 cell division protein FtsQ [Pseudomonas oryziphila]
MAEQAPPVTPSHRGYTAAVIGLLLLAQACGLWLLFNSKLDAAQLQPAAWFDGKAGKALGDALQPELQKNADTLSAAVRYRLLGDLGDQVVQGCPGWLFYRDGLRAQAGVKGAYEARLRLMQHWVGQLRSQGLQVLLVAVPDKSRIESQALCGLQQSPQLQARLGQWQASLASQGVPYADLGAALAHDAQTPPQFFRTDVHLNADGAQRAADAVAASALALLDGKRDQLFTSSQVGAAQPRMGDLIVLAGLEHAASAWRPAVEDEHPQQIQVQRSGGLLDDTPPVQVLLAGSSNGRRSAFAERLGRNLGQQVWNQSLDGGQFSGALLAALGKRERWPASLKLVIWEFSESALSLPLTADERAVLATLPEPQADHAL